MNECSHRTITRSGTLHCGLLGEFLPGPKSVLFACHACVATWADGRSRAASAEYALELGQYHPDSPMMEKQEDRVKICQACNHWRQNKCRLHCGCKGNDRADPNKDAGANCPMGKWRRPIERTAS